MKIPVPKQASKQPKSAVKPPTLGAKERAVQWQRLNELKQQQLVLEQELVRQMEKLEEEQAEASENNRRCDEWVCQCSTLDSLCKRRA